MSTLTIGTYPPSLEDPAERDALALEIKDWSIAHGLAVRPPPAVVENNPQGILAMNAPVTLFPSPFPRNCFEDGVAIQKTYNELYAAISNDEEFLAGLVQEIAGGDDFIANLWEVHQRVKKEGYVQPLSLGLFRSDYMVHQDGDGAPQIKQVEFNTIASSFGGLSAQTSLLHKHLAKTAYPLLKDTTAASTTSTLDLPPNNSAKGLAAGLHAAYTAYGKSLLNHQTCILFIVQDGERNIFDQRHLEYALQDLSSSPPVPVFRLPFSQILQQTTIHTSSSSSSDKRQLLYTPPTNPTKTYEAAVVYLRAGYGPSDYPSQQSWESRYQIERSNAIICPTILTQLAGMKKVQQVLATPPSSSSTSTDDKGKGNNYPTALKKFIQNEDMLQNLLKTFTNIYPLDTSPSGLKARSLANNPEQCKRYVMKPQREGGGNNFYKTSIPAHLKTIPEEHWSSYILMELITPPPLSNTILRNGNLEQGGVICELGIYGTCLWDSVSGEVLHNEQSGYLLRTKGDQSEEGGVAAGFGCMDSVALV